MPKVEDTSLPGWGSWAGPAELEKRQAPKAKLPRLNKRLLFKLPKAPPRKDSNKGHVIINEDKTNKFKEHLVSEHFLRVIHVLAVEYEALIRFFNRSYSRCPNYRIRLFKLRITRLVSERLSVGRGYQRQLIRN